MIEKDIKVIFLGDNGAGKTSIVNRIKYGRFEDVSTPTIFVESFRIKRDYKQKNIKFDLIFYDTPGQESLEKAISIQYILDSHIVVLVFCNIETLNILKDRWYKFYKENVFIDSRICLIANKSDIFDDQRDEIIKQGNIFADEIEAHFMICSAKSGDNMDNLERYITREAKRFIDEEIISKKPNEKSNPYKFKFKNTKNNNFNNNLNINDEDQENISIRKNSKLDGCLLF